MNEGASLEIRVDLALLPPEVKTLLRQTPETYLRDLAADLARAALTASRRPDALHQVIGEWQTTLEEIKADGDRLPEVLRARTELQSGQGLTLDELRIELEREE
jgi:hypothetical protein